MPKEKVWLVNIYRDGQLVDSLKLVPPSRSNFVISENSETGLYWYIDENPEHTREGIRKRLTRSGPRSGVLQIWLNGRMIKLIPSEWDLWINGKRCEKKTYRNLVIRWAKVELVYGAYRSEFLFPEFEGTDFPPPE